VIVVDKLLARGIGWVLRRVADAVHGELYDESSLREELLAAEMRLELGEIDEDEFRAIEEGILGRMREIRGRRASAAPAAQSGTRYALEAIEADVGEEPQGEESDRRRAARPRAKRTATRRQVSGTRGSG
jgi:hypothetical protein